MISYGRVNTMRSQQQGTKPMSPQRATLAPSRPLLFLLLLLDPNLPKIIGANNPNQIVGNTPASPLAAAKRLAAVNSQEPLNFLSAADARTQYQLLDSGDTNQLGLLDSSDTALLMTTDLLNSFQPKQYHLEAQTKPQRLAAGGKEGDRQHEKTPGHYEFEVAPKMEPPSAPKPPFKQANSVCPGSDPFVGFSPKHTLCGDLYQGKVPLNPMGQFVNDQAYPFEVIKNKTLQFLARSLPILKSEYDTIPKVARYLPANQLLNPTSHQSPLSHEHFHTLNQVEQQQSASDMMFAAMGAQPVLAPPFLRKKRSLGTASRQQQQQQHGGGITVAEIMPNATLVVSSAHSMMGKIGSAHYHGARSADALPDQQFTMITKDGHRPIITTNSGGNGSSVVATATTSYSARPNGQHDEQHKPLSARSASFSGQQEQQAHQISPGKAQQQEQPSRSHAAASQIGPGSQTVQQQHTGTILSRDHHHASQQAMSPRTSENRATGSDAATVHSGNNNQRDQLQQHLLARSASQMPDDAGSHQQSGQRDSPSATTTSNSGHSPMVGPHRNGGLAGIGSGLSRAATGKQAAGSGNSPLKCANVNGFLMYTVCQAASALIEPADSTPTWLQAAKQIGSLYAAASNTENYSSAGPTTSNPLWALWSAFSPGVMEKSSSSSSPSSSTDSTDQSNQDLAYKSSNGNYQNKGSHHSPISSVAGVISLINPLMSFFGPNLRRAGDAGTTHSTGASISKPDNRSSHHAPSGGASGLSNNLKTISNLLLAGLSIAGLYDWFGTSGIFAPTATTFARRKKPFDPSETFVDTPASLAAIAAAKQLSPGAAGTSPAASAIKQPPTPCPSVEEYISPTFARNYQGAWKYVVQIPHEGYFTQTIQRSSCMRKKCEFTEGVCHEAPRWVSLLVAEIYYPNAIFGAAQSQPASQIADRLAMDAGGQPNPSSALLNQFMATAPSTSQLQQVALGNGGGSAINNNNHQAKSMNGAAHHQDPLQMTDSLNTYNHNLNNAFLNAATELGLDPTNIAQMQQLANAHNYQFLQRDGLMPVTSQNAQQQMAPTGPVMQQVSAEPSSSVQNSNQMIAKQQEQYGSSIKVQAQQQQFVDQSQNQQVFSNDYIKALALETIRRHPHLSIDDLIKSLKMQQMRKKRDISMGGSGQQLSQQLTMSSLVPSQPQQYSQKLETTVQTSQHNNQQVRQVAQQNPSSLSPAENLPSINELGMGAHLTQQQQQQQQQLDLADFSQKGQPSIHQYQQTMGSKNQINGNRQASQILASQSSLAHEIAAANQLSQQHNHHRAQNDQQGPAEMPSNTGSGGSQTNAASNQADSQMECDGHDKIGCYVVRVYYDWFLVNGSCKCWKTNVLGQQQSGQSAASGSPTGSGSFIRRIFTG